MEAVQRLRDLLSCVCKIRISGTIDHKLVTKITKELESSRWRSVKALAIVVNSPGGSAAQSSILKQRIQAFGKIHNCEILAFTEDLAASGGYYALTAGKELFVNPGSLVGSIGALYNLFGLKDLAAKYGVERRSWSTSPSSLEERVDPLREIKPEVVKWVQSILAETHAEFKESVKQSRQQKLASDPKVLDETVFNADVFQAAKAIELGLVDSYGDVNEVLKARFPQYRVVDLSKPSRRELLMKGLKSQY
mmetsp:Transcript_22764/g.40947  ORF Transcript_22764/g.40947 Transcript_22764/m.40947 type:complete len:250 (-) Transcript_22764:24-773(-)